MFCFSLSPLRRGKVCPERAEGVRGLVIYSINQEENEEGQIFIVHRRR